MTTAFEFLLWLLAVFVHFFFLAWIPTGPSGSGMNLHEWIGWLGSSVILVVTWGRVDLRNEVEQRAGPGMRRLPKGFGPRSRG